MRIITSLAFLLLAALPAAAADMKWIKVSDDNNGFVLSESGQPFIPWGFNKPSEQERWQAQAVFWEAFAKACAESPAIFRYDLINEPVFAGGGKKRDDWLGPGSGGKNFVQYITLDRAGRDRPEIARQWIHTLVTAGLPPQYHNVTCEGTYPHHLQGICADKEAIYWSFTTTLVKTDLNGKLLKKVPAANHHGDLCYHDGKLYVAVNLGKFNDPKGNADSWVYVYDADTLKELARHEVQEVFHGAGGIGFRAGHFFVVGGLPDGVEENYVYEYNGDFKFVKKHVLKSGHTHLGIQTATFAHDRWWFGCYGDPKILLVTDADFQLKGRHEFDGSLGVEGLPQGRLLSATGRCEKDKGCTGSVQVAVPDEKAGLRYLPLNGGD